MHRRILCDKPKHTVEKQLHTTYNSRKAEWGVWEERKMILKTGDSSHDGSNQQQGAAMDVYTEWGLCKWQLKQ